MGDEVEAIGYKDRRVDATLDERLPRDTLLRSAMPRPFYLVPVGATSVVANDEARSLVAGATRLLAARA